MEKTQTRVVVPLDAGWNDVVVVGPPRVLPTDARNNVTRGDTVLEDTEGSYVYSESRLVATVGLRDHVVVETKDAVLVAPRDQGPGGQESGDRLKAEGRYETALHREVFRPWGSYDCIDTGDRFQVKRLTIKPGAALSLQMHHHRAEHWVVVRVRRGSRAATKMFLLSENQSTYIPMGVKHRIENPGRVPLHVIEVQSGHYLGEDDIVRFEDA